ncbi:MAG: DNA mismatch repair protein MutS [Mollicutes bacterium]|nr:DNA mismatch repair protein MutS [Mollicutes bacterium]
MKRNEVDKTKVTPMMSQYLDIKSEYEDVILMFRLGDFYEMFFEDAEVVSKELDLVLTGKNAGLNERIPMCGIPYHAANNYLEKLINKGYKVAICEQVEDPKIAQGIVKREVIQIISPGTIMNGDLLDENSNNFIGNVRDFDHSYVLTYADLSTGEIFVTLIDHSREALLNEILSLNIKEIIQDDKVDKTIIDLLRNKYKIIVSVYNQENSDQKYKYLYEDFSDIRLIAGIKSLVAYLSETQKRSLDYLQKVSQKESKDIMKMDIYTKRNLDLVENSRLKTRSYSLLWLLDKTKTAMGSRNLKRWIENPLTNHQIIEKRYDMIETLLEEFILKEELQALLYQIYDLERLCGRISYGNMNAKDLLQLKKSLRVLPDIQNILKNLNYSQKINCLQPLYELLEKSINEDAPLSLKEGNLIKSGFNLELDQIKANKKGDTDFILKIEQEERERTGIKNLKVGFNKIFGYYIEVTKGNIPLVKEEFNYQRKQTLANCERYITPLLKEKEELIIGAEEKIIELEYNLFMEIKDQTKQHVSEIQIIAKMIAEIDTLVSLAVVAEKNNYVRPKLNQTKEIKIINSRHPLVEKVMNEEFVPNDIILNEETNILIITGPNMAGKSTYLRQLAIISIMAALGSFVPAESAEIFIFDQIFTRIGASDDLVSGESTFMVEMMEANNAIQNATESSLILFDELGRGTATYDGMSLAQSIIEYIHDHIKCKTLFSTHYHELTTLEERLAKVKNVHVSALEELGNIIFLHKIKPGAVDKSYGIHVAKLAKLPNSLIKRANEILLVHENSSIKKPIVQEQLNLDTYEENKYQEIIEKIKAINVLEKSPLEALNILDEIKKEVINKEMDND